MDLSKHPRWVDRLVFDCLHPKRHGSQYYTYRYPKDAGFPEYAVRELGFREVGERTIKWFEVNGELRHEWCQADRAIINAMRMYGARYEMENSALFDIISEVIERAMDCGLYSLNEKYLECIKIYVPDMMNKIMGWGIIKDEPMAGEFTKFEVRCRTYDAALYDTTWYKMYITFGKPEDIGYFLYNSEDRCAPLFHPFSEERKNLNNHVWCVEMKEVITKCIQQM